MPCFYRELHTKLQVPGDLLPDVTPGGDVSCKLMFLVTLPSGAFVDPYQLKALEPFAGPDVSLCIVFFLFFWQI